MGWIGWSVRSLPVLHFILLLDLNPEPHMEDSSGGPVIRLSRLARGEGRRCSRLEERPVSTHFIVPPGCLQNTNDSPCFSQHSLPFSAFPFQTCNLLVSQRPCLQWCAIHIPECGFLSAVVNWMGVRAHHSWSLERAVYGCQRLLCWASMSFLNPYF